MFRRLVIALALAFLPPIATSALALDANAINTAEVGNKPGKKVNGPDPLLIKAQVLLDRARFSPGEIDGRAGGNFQKALAAFKVAQGLPTDSKLDANDVVEARRDLERPRRSSNTRSRPTTRKARSSRSVLPKWRT